MNEEENLTPWMQQYYEIKKDYSDSILFFRMWDFYEMFGSDAEIAHKVLWIAITSRNKNAANPIPLAWIPFHSKEKYLPILVNAWYKVAIAEQVSDPKLKWIVKREVLRVVTPSTLSLEWESYESANSLNYIVSIFSEKWKYWLSILELNSSKWLTWEFENFEKLKWELYKISPKEVILWKELFCDDKLKNILVKKYSLNIFYFEMKKDSKELLKEHFWVRNLECFGIEKRILATKASSQLLEYLQNNQKTDLTFLKSLSFDSFSTYMDLDEATIKSLDLIYNFSTNSSKLWTLFWVLNDTKTAMWYRFLKEQIIKPLQNINEINKRYEFIDEFVKNPILLEKVQLKLKTINDIDAILNRLAINRCLPRDLINLKKSLISVVEIYEIINESQNEVLKSFIN